ncbi:MAG TPA: DUF4352 domain-containing protein [Paludibaculum sp.]|jgi:hypothetical protein
MSFRKFFSGKSDWAGLVALSLIVFTGCSANKSDSGKTHQMGADAKVGALTYNVVETEWKDTLDGAMGPRTPKHRFLLVNLTVTNQGEQAVAIPLLNLIDAKGVEYREEDRGEGVSSWLGILRQAMHEEPLSGRILFDVPPGGYELRISSGGAAETETTAVVHLPFGADAPVKPLDPASVPASK